MAIPFAELNKVNPSSIIVLFELQLKLGLHIPDPNTENLETVFRFHNGSNLNLNSDLVFQQQSYQRVAVEAQSFEQSSTGLQVRPSLKFSNLGGILKDGVVRTMTDFLDIVNTVTPNNDLIDATVIRRQVLASSLDNENFRGNNPFGTPSNNELRKQIFRIDRKASENRTFVQFELSSVLDMQNLLIPRRVVTREIFPAVGNFV
tara:strand:+ start:2042 stop:2653 length:612 start_codon:yes stop_codon:yes gene_type:complete